MPRRNATSLVEVLISIFIMALGLMALLTLFPLGAVHMSRALQDHRAGTLAANSAAHFRWYWRKMTENAMARQAQPTLQAQAGSPLFTGSMFVEGTGPTGLKPLHFVAALA